VYWDAHAYTPAELAALDHRLERGELPEFERIRVL